MSSKRECLRFEKALDFGGRVFSTRLHGDEVVSPKGETTMLLPSKLAFSIPVITYTVTYKRIRISSISIGHRDTFRKFHYSCKFLIQENTSTTQRWVASEPSNSQGTETAVTMLLNPPVTMFHHHIPQTIAIFAGKPNPKGQAAERGRWDQL